MHALADNRLSFGRVARWSVAFLCAALAGVTGAEEPVDFNRDIRPILSENCFFCHGQDGNKRQAGLRLDIRDEALELGAIAPGKPQESELVARITSDDVDLLMPPPHSNRELSDTEKAILVRWIEEGAEYDAHWAFVAPVRPLPPEVRDGGWARNPIDQFVLARLEEAGLAPSPEADRATLIKRLSIDLVGLPPTPAEVDQFVNDSKPGAYERLVDRLLASPHYGERQALPWLDAARYADSNGFQQDGDTWQWMWRDWVVRAINDDIPFDQFTIWQLAGDLFPNPTTDQKIASGFNRNHVLNGEGGAIAEEQRFNNLFDRVDTTATTWLGLTMACAQCHDHKYDPITQADYYRFLDAFNRVPEQGVPGRQSARIRVAPPFLELPTVENQARIAEWEKEIAALQKEVAAVQDVAWRAWRAGIEGDGNLADLDGLTEETKGILTRNSGERSAAEQEKLEAELKKHFAEKVRDEVTREYPAAIALKKARDELNSYRGDQIPRPMVMSDAQPRQTHILDRGQYLQPLEPVSFDTPEFLPPLRKGAPTNRLGLAQWLVAPENPLTARVQVNRMWQFFFGTGLVRTSEDLGVQSEYPLHRDLLDWLAVEFREAGWSRKAMHRLIVTSATYRQSSRVTPQQLERDPENRLWGRAVRQRMPSMILRDWALAAAGLLVDRIGGAPVYPYQPENVWESLAITKERDFTYPASHGDDLYRRSLYTFWRRTVGPANLFDASNRQTCRVRLTTTSTPLHALTMLNDTTWVEAARVLAQKSTVHGDSLDERLTWAFRRVLCRPPADSELEQLRRMHARQRAIFERDRGAAEELLQVGEAPHERVEDPVEQAALASVCLGLFNLDEAMTRE